MDNLVIEATYPITFREHDTTELGKYLLGRHSVMLIGMKRVGISNFLRFFLNHKHIKETYISKNDKHLFIPVDLNDLVEREVFPFWVLTLKRISDTVEHSPLFSQRVKKEIATYFLNGIQSKELLLLIDIVRRSLLTIIQQGAYPSLFFLRFDRMQEAATAEFFNNLQGLKDATHQKMSYVFTSYRGLDKIFPGVFTQSSLSLFTHDMYIQPAKRKDVEIVRKAYLTQYGQKLPTFVDTELFVFVDGYIQYLQLALVFLRQQHGNIKNKEELFNALIADEQIHLQSEELWESLEQIEQEVLLGILKGDIFTSDDRKRAKYLWDTGLVADTGSKISIFSPLFSSFVKQRGKKGDQHSVEFTKKEHLLFSFLKEHINEICEREKIIEAVWSEVTTLGVTDWAIDRLVARVRSKLKRQNDQFEIKTVKTRGYKLVSSV